MNEDYFSVNFKLAKFDSTNVSDSNKYSKYGYFMSTSSTSSFYCFGKKFDSDLRNYYENLWLKNVNDEFGGNFISVGYLCKCPCWRELFVPSGLKSGIVKPPRDSA